jgi:MFS transporter, UMF1 family
MRPSRNPEADPRRIRPRALVAWCLYDFGVAAWPVVIATFVFGTYFTKAIAVSPERGTAEWGTALSLAGLAVAILGPVLGAVADYAGRRKPWIAGFALATIIATGLLWFSRPSPDAALRTLLLVALGSMTYEFGLIFYNAMLRDLVPAERMGRLSGWGWGLGYIGGLLCLIVALEGLLRASPPPFGLDKAAAEPVRATAILVALWFGLFALPLLALVPDRPPSGRGLAQAAREGLSSLGRRLRALPRERDLARFLLARMIYADGLNTLFIFGGIFAAGRYGLSLEQVILFAIGINATAGLGAVALAGLDDRIGSKPTIILSLVGLILLGGATLLTRDARWFWVLGLGLGVFVGPAQSASRTLMARMAPKGLEVEMFGLYALTGRITAFTGPALYGWAVALFASQAAGMATVLAYLAVGLALLLTVRSASS